MRCKAKAGAACASLGSGTAMPIGIASICNAAARPYRMGSTDPISVIQWTRHKEPLHCLEGTANQSRCDHVCSRQRALRRRPPGHAERLQRFAQAQPGAVQHHRQVVGADAEFAADLLGAEIEALAQHEGAAVLRRQRLQAEFELL